MTYTPEQLDRMAAEHDAHSVCTQPARDHFAEVCREYADLRRAVLELQQAVAEGEFD